MRRLRVFWLLIGMGVMLLVVMLPAVASAQSAQGFLDKMLAAESKRAKGVDDYAMDVSVMGHETTLYYERVSMRGPNGKPMDTFRLVSFAQIAESAAGGARNVARSLGSVLEGHAGNRRGRQRRNGQGHE